MAEEKVKASFPSQVTDQTVKELTEEEMQRLSLDTNLVSEFKQNKLEVDAQKNWDLFYKRNTTKFFKDRHWTKREFQDLTEQNTKNKQVIFEVGCGVGNFLFPLLEEDANLVFYACDFSPRAVDFVKSHQLYDPTRCTAFQCDITKDIITDTVPVETVDTATLIFVLSAVHPEKMVAAIQNIVLALKPGGVLLVRDYGLYDHAMLRFSKGHKLGDSFYVRQDGTRAFYFSLEQLSSIMESAGLKTENCCYINRATVNKKENINVQRIFVQGRFVKLSSDKSDREDINGAHQTCAKNNTTVHTCSSPMSDVNQSLVSNQDTSSLPDS